LGDEEREGVGLEGNRDKGGKRERKASKCENVTE
jgi:hypothetical protein